MWLPARLIITSGLIVNGYCVCLHSLIFNSVFYWRFREKSVKESWYLLSGGGVQCYSCHHLVVWWWGPLVVFPNKCRQKSSLQQISSPPPLLLSMYILQLWCGQLMIDMIHMCLTVSGGIPMFPVWNKRMNSSVISILRSFGRVLEASLPPVALVGVIFASISSGLGELSFLSLTVFFSR